MIAFDIETGPENPTKLVKMMPRVDLEKLVPHPGEFDSAAVKHGNTKDEAKRAAKVREEQLKHEAMVRSLPERRIRAVNDEIEKFRSRAALSATTGRVLAFAAGDLIVSWHDFTCDQEQCLLDAAWSYLAGWRNAGIVGHNLLGFDLPFLVRRSWILDVRIPNWVREGRYFSPCFHDTMLVWACGTREMISLDELDRALGGPGKPEGIDGGDFDRLYWADETRQQAIDYLKNDIEMTRRVATALGIV